MKKTTPAKTPKAKASSIKTEYLIVGGLGIAAVAYAVLNKDKAIEVVNSDPAVTQPVVNQPVKTVVSSGGTTVTLNNTLLLKKGSVGNEVRQLQKLLGVAVDGDFGPLTETALKTKKGVIQITLNGYAAAADINNAALAIGNRVMVKIPAGIRTTLAKSNAAGSFYDSGIATGVFSYGIELGKIVSMTPAKNIYVVERITSDTLYIPVYLWVKATDVSKI